MKERGLLAPRSCPGGRHARDVYVIDDDGRPLAEAYDGPQIVGMDLHRRRSGTQWLDELPLPRPYCWKVASLWQLTGWLSAEITVLEQVSADLLAGHDAYRAVRELPGSGRCSGRSSSPRSATSPGPATRPGCARGPG
jgi:hypothetical protein